MCMHVRVHVRAFMLLEISPSVPDFFHFIENSFFLTKHILIMVFPPSSPSSSLPDLPSGSTPFVSLIRKQTGF